MSFSIPLIIFISLFWIPSSLQYPFWDEYTIFQVRPHHCSFRMTFLAHSTIQTIYKSSHGLISPFGVTSVWILANMIILWDVYPFERSLLQWLHCLEVVQLKCTEKSEGSYQYNNGKYWSLVISYNFIHHLCLCLITYTIVAFYANCMTDLINVL